MKRSTYDTAYKVGKREGISLGIKQNKKQIAKAMLTENIDIKTVSKITGLPKKQVEALKLS